MQQQQQGIVVSWLQMIFANSLIN